MKNKRRTPEAPTRAKAPPPPETRLLSWWWVAGGAVLALIAYLPALRAPFLFDDLSLPMMAPGGPEYDWFFFLKRGIRALFNLSLLADHWLWGANPFPFHMFSWVLHVANAFITGRILRLLLERSGTNGAQDRVVAAFGAGAFLLHPIQTEAVSYVASRSEVLSVFFAYLALMVFLSGRDESIGWGRALAVMVLFGLALISKETSVALVGVFLLADLFRGGNYRFGAIVKNWRLYVPMLAVGAGAGWAFLKVAGREGSAGFELKGITALDYLVTQFQVFWVYLRLFLLPFGQNFDHAFPMEKAPGGIFSWLGLAGIVTLIVLAWIYRRRYPLAAFGCLAFLILLAPTSSILPIADALAERRLYLPMIGLLLVISEVLRRAKIGHAVTVGLGILLVMLAVMTMNRNEKYVSPLAMWADAIEKNPRNSRAHFQLAYALYQEGRCAEAAEWYRKSGELKKPDYRLLVDWALALDCAGKAEDALTNLHTATTLENNSHAWSLIGMIHGKRGETGQALDAIEKALAINARDDMALVYRGNVRLTSGQVADARQDFQAALVINPNNQAARQGLASAAGR